MLGWELFYIRFTSTQRKLLIPFLNHTKLQKPLKLLKPTKLQGKVNKKSCVSWKIEKYDLDHEDLIVEGEAEEIEERK